MEAKHPIAKGWLFYGDLKTNARGNLDLIQKDRKTHVDPSVQGIKG